MQLQHLCALLYKQWEAWLRVHQFRCVPPSLILWYKLNILLELEPVGKLKKKEEKKGPKNELSSQGSVSFPATGTM